LILGAEPGLRIRRWPSRAARCSLSHPACFRGLRLRLAVAARRRLMAMRRRWRDFLNRPSRTGSRSRRGALAGVGGDADDGGGRPDDCRTEGGRWYRWRRSRPSIHPFPPAGRGAPGWPCVGWSCLRRPPDRARGGSWWRRPKRRGRASGACALALACLRREAFPSRSLAIDRDEFGTVRLILPHPG
jgi:hypothetical protein